MKNKLIGITHVTSPFSRITFIFRNWLVCLVEDSQVKKLLFIRLAMATQQTVHWTVSSKQISLEHSKKFCLVKWNHFQWFKSISSGWDAGWCAFWQKSCDRSRSTGAPENNQSFKTLWRRFTARWWHYHVGSLRFGDRQVASRSPVPCDNRQATATRHDQSVFTIVSESLLIICYQPINGPLQAIT